MDLPNEITEMIIGRLGYKSVWKLRATCRKFANDTTPAFGRPPLEVGDDRHDLLQLLTQSAIPAVQLYARGIYFRFKYPRAEPVQEGEKATSRQRKWENFLSAAANVVIKNTRDALNQTTRLEIGGPASLRDYSQVLKAVIPRLRMLKGISLDVWQDGKPEKIDWYPDIYFEAILDILGQHGVQLSCFPNAGSDIRNAKYYPGLAMRKLSVSPSARFVLANLDGLGLKLSTKRDVCSLERIENMCSLINGMQGLRFLALRLDRSPKSAVVFEKLSKHLRLPMLKNLGFTDFDTTGRVVLDLLDAHKGTLVHLDIERCRFTPCTSMRSILEFARDELQHPGMRNFCLNWTRDSELDRTRKITFRNFEFAGWKTVGIWPETKDKEDEEGWVTVIRDFSQLSIHPEDMTAQKVQEAIDCMDIEELTYDDFEDVYDGSNDILWLDWDPLHPLLLKVVSFLGAGKGGRCLIILVDCSQNLMPVLSSPKR